MNKQTIGWVMVIVGLVVALLGALMDSLYAEGQPGIGYKQIFAIVVGVIVAIVGFTLSRQPRPT